MQLVGQVLSGWGGAGKQAQVNGDPAIAYEPRADARSWQAMTNFLADLFA